LNLVARDQTAGRQIRVRIANIAARLMAVDGVNDLAFAKRKAAREAGAAETRNLPSNEEVETALRDYLQLYQADEHAARLRHLRSCALEMMRTLDRFNPYLSGPVLEGNAGRYADIDLHLFTDGAKDVEFFMLNTKLEYRVRERRVQRGNLPDTISLYSVRTEAADFEISVFAPNDLRISLRASASGRPFRHAGAESIEAMLAEESSGLTT
jgi:hypothetical protein